MYYMYFSSGTFYFRKKSSTSLDSALTLFFLTLFKLKAIVKYVIHSMKTMKL